MAVKKHVGESSLRAADDAPELTDAFFRDAELRHGDTVIRRGRPRLAEPKQLVAIRFPQATLARLRARGPGWQALVVRAVEKELAGEAS
jgi:uncharacterized protein (DUF4415 family)